MMPHKMQQPLLFFALVVELNLGFWILLAQEKKYFFEKK